MAITFSLFLNKQMSSFYEQNLQVFLVVIFWNIVSWCATYPGSWNLWSCSSDTTNPKKKILILRSMYSRVLNSSISWMFSWYLSVVLSSAMDISSSCLTPWVPSLYRKQGLLPFLFLPLNVQYRLPELDHSASYWAGFDQRPGDIGHRSNLTEFKFAFDEPNWF